MSNLRLRYEAVIRLYATRPLDRALRAYSMFHCYYWPVR
jgi:hypothetical protein